MAHGLLSVHSSSLRAGVGVLSGIRQCLRVASEPERGHRADGHQHSIGDELVGQGKQISFKYSLVNLWSNAGHVNSLPYLVIIADIRLDITANR